MQSTLLCSLTLFLVFNALLSEATFRCFSCNDTGGAGACSAGTNYTYTSEDDKPCYIQIEGSNFRRGVCASDCAAELAVPNAVTYTCNYSECNHVYGNPQSTDPTCLWCPFSGCAGNTQRENGIICYMALSKDGITIYRGACNDFHCGDKLYGLEYNKLVICTGVDCNSAMNNNDGAFDKISCYKCSGGSCPIKDWQMKSALERNALSVTGTGLGCIAIWSITWSDLFLIWDSCVTATCTEEKSTFLSNYVACKDGITSYPAYASVCNLTLCNRRIPEITFTTGQPCTTTAATSTTSADTDTSLKATITTTEAITTTITDTSTDATDSTMAATGTTTAATDTSLEAAITTTMATDSTTAATGTTTAATGTTTATHTTTEATTTTITITDTSTAGTTTTVANGSSVRAAVSSILNTLMGMCTIVFGLWH